MQQRIKEREQRMTGFPPNKKARRNRHRKKKQEKDYKKEKAEIIN